ncbi:MAG: glutathione peroxidase [Gammaproteobacteria bacterium]|nr:glutathione peroxidase [Gammaproteobacteria bacterium]
MSLYEFKALQKNEEVSLEAYKGKVLLIVNTATRCGFTPQYDGLEALYEKYSEKGFEILDFPCNQFLAQAPGDDEKINEFCTLKYGTKFPRFSKIKVNGKEELPLFRFLKDNAPENTGKNIKWNFTKFLVDKEGNVVHRFEPTVKPEDIEEEIAKLL